METSLDKSKIKILLLEGLHQNALDRFTQAGYSQIEYHKGALSEADLLKSIADAHFVGLRSRTQLSAEVLAAAKKLVAVGCFCIGTNQVDLQAATERGVAVFNAPYSNTRSVAELVIAQAILLLRGIPEKNAQAHRGVWMKSADHAYEIRGKTLGIVGYGNIGMQLSVIAEALGMQVIFYDVVSKLPLGNAQQVGSLQELMGQSDVVSLHVPDNPSTRQMIGAQELAWAKPGAIFINAARGTVVQIDALVASLRTGHIAGAAVDVFPVEPKTNKDEFISPLREFDNVILTPHIGGSTLEAQANIGSEVAEKLVRYSDNGTTTSSVNLPEVALPAHPDRHRILHIHQNRPGMMAAINRAFSDLGANISAQYLQTNETVGYVVMDVDAQHSRAVLAKLHDVEGTLKTRLLFPN